jgi:hypothetical protein
MVSPFPARHLARERLQHQSSPGGTPRSADVHPSRPGFGGTPKSAVGHPSWPESGWHPEVGRRTPIPIEVRVLPRGRPSGTHPGRSSHPEVDRVHAPPRGRPPDTHLGRSLGGTDGVGRRTPSPVGGWPVAEVGRRAPILAGVRVGPRGASCTIPARVCNPPRGRRRIPIPAGVEVVPRGRRRIPIPAGVRVAARGRRHVPTPAGVGWSPEIVVGCPPRPELGGHPR